MIQLVGAGKRFGHKELFTGLSWHLTRGLRVGLVGPNGCGKTTLLKILAGRLEPDEGHVVTSKGVSVGLLEQEHEFSSELSVFEEVRRASTDLQAVEAEIKALEADLDPQDPEALERYGQLRDRFEAMGGYTAETEARRVLSGLGFRDAEMDDPASRFSGGWRMRIALARLLLVRPDVLLLDEPTNHLDLESIAWLEDELGKWEGTVVTVSHDRYYLNRACRAIAELTPQGVVTYVGDYDTFLEQRERNRELNLKRYEEQQKEIEKTKAFIERFRYKSTKAAAVQSRVKALDKIERVELMQSSKSMRGFHFPQPGRSGRFVVELEGIRKAYDDNVVYDGLDLQLERGRKIALVGVNGAGKTTLLRIIADAIELDGGTRRLGANVDVGYFAQHQVEALHTDWTVLQEMEAAADVETYPLIRGILGAFLFSGEDVDKKVGVLSGGEKARLALCRLLLRPVALLLLDEPTSHLDLESRQSLEDALSRYVGTLVVVSHDRYFVNTVCDYVLEVAGTGQGGADVRWYPGNYDDYLWKKKEEGGDEGHAVRTSAGLVETGDTGPAPKDDERARKRREAEERQRVYRETKALRAELEQVEARIEAHEQRTEEIDGLLADPAAYAAGGPGQALALERAEVQAALERDMGRWEELEAAIEDVIQAKT